VRLGWFVFNYNFINFLFAQIHNFLIFDVFLRVLQIWRIKKGVLATALPFDLSGAIRVSGAGEERSDNIKSENITSAAAIYRMVSGLYAPDILRRILGTVFWVHDAMQPRSLCKGFSVRCDTAEAGHRATTQNGQRVV
jgi:hypothetical protein